MDVPSAETPAYTGMRVVVQRTPWASRGRVLIFPFGHQGGGHYASPLFFKGAEKVCKRAANLLLVDVDGFHDVALFNCEHYVHAAGDFAENGVAGCSADFAGLKLSVDVGVEVRSRRVGDEELRCVGVESGVGHR